MRFYLLILVTLGFIPSAYAYLDPGSGSFILQMLFATLIGAGITLKMHFQRAKDACKKLFSPKKKVAANEDQHQSNQN